MVQYLAATGNGIERYAETDSGVMGVPLDSYKRKIEYAEPGKVDPGALGENVSVREQGYWVKPETLPKQYLWANGGRPLPDVLPGFVVSLRFRELIEQFEAGVHQFIPIEIYKDREGGPVATYFWFIVGQRLDSVDRNHTTYIWKATPDTHSGGYWTRRVRNPSTRKYDDIPSAELVFSDAKVVCHHIWHDPHLLTFGNGLCSEAFAKAVTAGHFTGVEASPRKTA